MKKISILSLLLIPSILFSVTQADVKSTIDDLSQSVAFTETVQDSSGPIVTTLWVSHVTDSRFRLPGGLPCGSTLAIRRETKQAGRRVAYSSWDVDLGKARIGSQVSGSSWTISVASSGVMIQQTTQGNAQTQPVTRNLSSVTIQGNNSYSANATLIAMRTVAVGMKAVQLCQK
jgi:hypothetical protein